MKATHPSRSFLATTTLLLLSGLTNSKTEAVSCMGDEEVLEFTFFLDEDSKQENGWTLTCDGMGTIWDVPVGTIESRFRFQDPETPFVSQQVCIALDETCTFTLEDSFGDGIVDPGYFYLTHGATTLLVSKVSEEFYEKSSCFGPDCNVEPQEMAEQCDDFFLFFQANDNPEYNTVRVECDGEVIFVKSDFEQPQQTTEFDACIPSHKCCNVVINDSDPNTNSLQGVKLNVEWAGKVILTHDTSDQDASSTIQQSFGLTCEAHTGDNDAHPPVVNANATADTSVQNTTTTTQSMNAPTFKDSGGFIALVVMGSLLVVGVLVVLVSCRSNSTSKESRGVKDLEVQSTGSKETDLEEDA